MRSFPSVVVLAASLVLLLGRTASSAGPELQTRARGASIVSLKAVDELRTAFNQDTGTVRIVLLLSPT